MAKINLDLSREEAISLMIALASSAHHMSGQNVRMLRDKVFNKVHNSLYPTVPTNDLAYSQWVQSFYEDVQG